MNLPPRKTASVAETPKTFDLEGVRRREGVAIRSMARQLEMTVTQVREIEANPAIITLEMFSRYAQVLGVPIAEFHQDPNTGLDSCDQHARKRLIIIMRHVNTLLRKLGHHSDSAMALEVQEYVTTIRELLIAAMPELERVGGVITVGRRKQDELGQAAYRARGFEEPTDVE